MEKVSIIAHFLDNRLADGAEAVILTYLLGHECS
jgi:hypothetical protein